MAANIASQRAPWELNIVLRDELATVMSNRAAAFLEAGDCISSLVDAEVVIQLRRNWSKGYFRKAKALLKMNKAQEARDAIQSGLAFDPDNKVPYMTVILSRTAHSHPRLGTPRHTRAHQLVPIEKTGWRRI